MTDQKKIVLVTGASRGIGQAIAAIFANQSDKYTVIGTATSESGAEKITSTLREYGDSHFGIALNIADADSISAALATIKETALDLPDILVNNAGITRDNLIMRLSDEDWDAVVQTNLSSIFRMTKALLRSMMKKRWGRVINVGSVIGSTGNLGQGNYAAAKAGVIGYSKSLAQEVASRNITVNTVAPGFIDTDMTKALPDAEREMILNKIPMKSMGSPEDIAATVAFLASDGARYITGETIHINGGMYMH